MTLLMLEFLIHYRFIVGETRAVLSYGGRETAIPTMQWENRGRKHNAQNVFHLIDHCGPVVFFSYHAPVLR